MKFRPYSFIFKHWEITIVIVAVVLFIFIGWVMLFGPQTHHDGAHFNKGTNAIWVKHSWVSEAKTFQEIEEFITFLASKQITNVFMHVGPLDSDGSIPDYRYAEAENFLDVAHRITKRMKFQAWVGQIRSKIDLDDPDVRKNIAVVSRKLTNSIGFDGIHFDIEPVGDGDEAFILLLEDVRYEIPEGKIISVALSELIPRSIVTLLSPFWELENYNSEKYYKQVAKYADQVVAMTYDTSIDDEWLYRFLVRHQLIAATRALDDKEVFIGIPTYDDIKAGFNPAVENIRTGLLGIVDGLNNLRSDKDSFAGVAIYSNWETDQAEWNTYDELWLTPSSEEEVNQAI
ncbi:MAG: glycosyl hydrolase family 18 protein [Patescibacteria group bacterium]|nr:glycoside hydrolase family 18 protein [Patescibacteria group bacterium]